MNRVLLDTCAYSAFFRGHPGVIAVLRTADEIVFSAVVLGELRAGFAHGADRARNEHELDLFLASARSKVAGIGAETSLRYAEIVTYVRSLGAPIPTNDIWIAASAMELGAAVLTTDAHFRKIPHILTVFHDP
jgi:tRNA(fMet)-specific endonuclease VapC